MQRGSASRGGSGPGLASRVVRHVERDSRTFRCLARRGGTNGSTVFAQL